MARKYRNVTCRGKRDGFGCQLLCKMSVAAYCSKHPGLRYVHSPFVSVSHGWREHSQMINEFIGFPSGRGRRIHVNLKHGDNRVYLNPSYFYDNKCLSMLRAWYWSGKKPVTQASTEDSIVVHIRRGDLFLHTRTKARLTSNEFYRERIPKIAASYSDSYRIILHSEGSPKDFESVFEGWPKDLIDRTVLKLQKEGNEVFGENNMLETYHDLVCAKVLVQAKSGLSYTAGLFNENDVYFIPGSNSRGQNIPHDSWNIMG